MTYPNRAQWLIIWIAAAVCTWLNVWSDFDKMLWNSQLYIPQNLLYYERRQFTLVIALFGLLHTWQFSHVSFGDVFDRINRQTAGRPPH